LRHTETRKVDDLVNDLCIVFDCLQANRVKLNPKKCAFGVPRGMLLGYIVSQWGIEPNPEKVASLDRMAPIRELKGVQKVLGCLTSLRRFISRLSEKGLPLYRLLKKHERFSWTVEAQEALDKLKVTLARVPILMPPQSGEPLYLYVAATTQVVNAVIMVGRTEEGHALPVERPVYYVSEVLFETKSQYPQIQKLLSRWCLCGASCGTTSRPTQSRWSPHSRWGRSSVTRTPRTGSPSGLWNSLARHLCAVQDDQVPDPHGFCR
jgi:hypothetical protein